MNNEAFQKMVRGASTQSSKAIARAAVEEEFKKRHKGKKRKHGDDYSSESDNDNDDDDKKDKRRKKDGTLLFRPTQVKGGAAAASDEQEEDTYRDRAKERREGGAAPRLSKEESSASALATADNQEIPLPVATKGLDLTLVRKERQQLQRKGGGSGSSDEGGENEDEALDQAAAAFSASQGLPTIDQARRSLEKMVADPSSHSALPTELAEYAMQYATTTFSLKESNKKIVCRVEGRTLQRTCLVMSMEAHPSDRTRAWEIPRELIHPNAQEYPVIPLLTHEMLESIEQFFPLKSKKKKGQAANESSAMEMVDVQAASAARTKKEEQERQSQPSQKHATEVLKPETAIDEDEDDDIFGGLGDYFPPQTSTK
jgi:hypothetical protein